MTDDFDDATQIEVPPHVLSRETAGETVLMSLENEQCFALAGAGNRLWEHVSGTGGLTVGELIACMQADFDVDGAVLRSDVYRMLNELAELGLITAV